MKTFTPCQGKTACRDEGEGCLTCGRSFSEIQQTRALVESLAELALSHDYSNVEAFADYIAKRLVKKVRSHRQPG